MIELTHLKKIKLRYWLLACLPIILIVALTLSPLEVSLNHQITIEGNVEIATVPYYSEVSGKVLDLLVNQGQDVQPGDVLLTIDESANQDQIKELETNLTKAQETLNLLTSGIAGNDYQTMNNNIEIARQQMFNAQTDYLFAITHHEKGQTYLQENKIDDIGLTQLRTARDEAQRLFEISEKQFDNALKASSKTNQTDKSNIVSTQAEVNLLHYRLAQAKQDLAKYTIQARARGKVIAKPIETGAIVSPGSPILSLSKEDEKYAVFWVPQEYLDRVSYGQTMTVKNKPVTTHDSVTTFDAQVVYLDLQAQYTPKDAANPTNQNKLSFKVKLLLPAHADLYAAQKVELTLER